MPLFPLLFAAGAAHASSFTLSESLSDLANDEGLRVVIDDVSLAGVDLSGGLSLALAGEPLDPNVGNAFAAPPIRFDKGCAWWDLPCHWDRVASSSATRVTRRFLHTATHVNGSIVVAGAKPPFQLSFPVQTDVAEELVILTGEVQVTNTKEADSWVEIACGDGACVDASGAVLGSFPKGAEAALRLRVAQSGKGKPRAEVQQSVYLANASGAVPPLGGVTLAVGDLIGDGAEFSLSPDTTTVYATATAADAASLADLLGTRQGDFAVDFTLTDSTGAVLASGFEALEVDRRDLLLRRLKFDFDEVDGVRATLALAASDLGDLAGGGELTLAKPCCEDDVLFVVHHGNIDRIHRAPVPTPGGPPGQTVVATVTALDAAGKALGAPMSCDLALTPGATCTLSDGTEVEHREQSVGADGKTTEVIRLSSALADVDGDGAPDDAVSTYEVTLMGTSGSGTALTDRKSYTSRAALDLGGPVDAVGTWEWSATLWSDTGVTNVTGGVFEMKAQFGEILIDGVVWELE